VIGRSSLHRGTRTFNVGRIVRLEPLDDPYEIPRGFSIDRYLRNAWHLIPEPGPDREVVVRFARKVAQNVAEVAWHKTQRLQFLPDGSLDFSVTVSGLSEIAWWILGYGDQAEVLQPPELRQIIVGHAVRMLQRYGERHVS
jgi:proteasome accessory factor B